MSIEFLEFTSEISHQNNVCKCCQCNALEMNLNRKVTLQLVESKVT